MCCSGSGGVVPPGEASAMSDSKTFTKDPTCGMDVDEATSQHTVRDGKTYSFCSDSCQKAFESVSEGASKTCA
jgi:Cu+-exporting ATPase